MSASYSPSIVQRGANKWQNIRPPKYWTTPPQSGVLCCNKPVEAGVTRKSWRILDSLAAQYVRAELCVTIHLTWQQVWQTLNSWSDHAGEHGLRSLHLAPALAWGLPSRRKLQRLPNLAPSYFSFHVTAAASLFLTEGFVIAGLS